MDGLFSLLSSTSVDQYEEDKGEDPGSGEGQQ